MAPATISGRPGTADRGGGGEQHLTLSRDYLCGRRVVRQDDYFNLAGLAYLDFYGKPAFPSGRKDALLPDQYAYDSRAG